MFTDRPQSSNLKSNAKLMQSSLRRKSLSAIVLSAGTLAGCATPNESARFEKPAANTGTQPVQAAMAEQTPAGSDQAAGQGPAGASASVEGSGAGGPSARNWRPGQKLEPFWISMIAEADRAKWDDRAAMALGTESVHNPDTLTLNATPVMMERAAGVGGSDTAEGLTHVTFAPEGADFDPAVSKDGRFMVFASTQHRPTADIYYKLTGGRTITQLTSDPGNDVMPAISADGQRVAFASNRAGNWNIYVMSATGGQALQLTNDPSPELHPSWSPDGKKIVFCRLGQTSGRWEMWVMDVSGSGSSEFLGFGMFPEWCPTAKTGMDGRDRILFQRSRERGDRAFGIWTIDYSPGNASSPTEIVSGPNQAMINGHWSPDGERIVYAVIDQANDMKAGGDGTMSRLPQSSLWMTSVDGTQRVMLTGGPTMNLMPTWSSDGRIYFVSNRAGVPNVWSLGTEKAVFAATGMKPKALQNTDVATAPEQATESEK